MLEAGLLKVHIGAADSPKSLPHSLNGGSALTYPARIVEPCRILAKQYREGAKMSMNAKVEFEGQQIARDVLERTEATRLLEAHPVRFHLWTIPVILMVVAGLGQLVAASEFMGELVLNLAAATGAVLSISAWAVCFRLNKRLNAVLALLKQRT